MKAAILVEQNQPLIVGDVELPETLEYGQVRVKILYSGICGAQINEIEGRKGEDKFLPHLLGHEGSGIVQKCGPGVNKVQKGDHVVLHWRKGSGIQSATPKYTWKNKPLNAGWVTTFNEFGIISEDRLTRIPKDFEMDVAPLYGCAITTAFGVISNDANLKSGESIAIFGAGGVGTAILLAASLTSAHPIIAIDINDYKLSQAEKSGATHMINSTTVDVKEEINKILPDGIDVVIDTTGISKIRELSYELTNKSGRTVFVGVPKGGEKINIDSFPLHFSKKITGSHGGDSRPEYDIPRLIRLQQSGRFNLTDMISKCYALDEINEAINDLRSGEVTRCIIKMDHNE